MTEDIKYIVSENQVKSIEQNLNEILNSENLSDEVNETVIETYEIVNSLKSEEQDNQKNNAFILSGFFLLVIFIPAFYTLGMSAATLFISDNVIIKHLSGLISVTLVVYEFRDLYKSVWQEILGFVR